MNVEVMCRGKECPISRKCIRALATPRTDQKYMESEPYEAHGITYKCAMLVPTSPDTFSQSK